MDMMNIKNAKPKSYKAFYIEPGLADYTEEGIGMVLVQKPALDRINPTYVGKPIVNLEHTDKEPEELFELSKNSKPEDFADGIIAATGLLKEDYVCEDGRVVPAGWYWMDFLVWDQETINSIDKNGYSVSCAYDITEAEETGGSYHNIDYDAEVLNGEGLHLAIVPNPRYESSFVIKNSKSNTEETVKVKFFKKKPVKNQEPEDKKKPDEEEDEVIENADGYVENEKGEQTPISELVNMYKEKMAKRGPEKVYNMDDDVEVDGKKMKVSELLSAIEEDEPEEVDNAEPPQDEVAEEVVDETKQVSNAKVKNANFAKVKNAAHGDSVPVEKNLNTSSERLARGKSRYGTPVNQGGK